MTGPCTRIRTFLLVLYPGKHLIEIKASFPREAWHRGSKSKQTNIQSLSLSAESVCFWKNINPAHQFLYGKKEEHLVPLCTQRIQLIGRRAQHHPAVLTLIQPTHQVCLNVLVCVCATIHTSHHLTQDYSHVKLFQILLTAINICCDGDKRAGTGKPSSVATDALRGPDERVCHKQASVQQLPCRTHTHAHTHAPRWHSHSSFLCCGVTLVFILIGFCHFYRSIQLFDLSIEGGTGV